MRVDDLTLNLPLVVIRHRPVQGDPFELGVGFNDWGIGLRSEHGGRSQWRLYMPLTLLPLGLSNTDQDQDGKVRWFGRAGIGLGTDVIVRIAGPVGLQLAPAQRHQQHLAARWPGRQPRAPGGHAHR